MAWRAIDGGLALALLVALGALVAAFGGAAPATVLGVGLFALELWLAAVGLTLAWPDTVEEADDDGG